MIRPFVLAFHKQNSGVSHHRVFAPLICHKDEPEKIALITQSTYVTLFASEMGYDMVDELVEDMVVKTELQNFDEELKKLLTKDDDGEGGA